VTHDQVEAMTLADRVVVMNKGVIEQIAPPEELYLKPATRFVAGFIGSPGMNFFSVTIEGSGDTLSVRMPDGQSLAVPSHRLDLFRQLAGKPAILGIRPEHFSLTEGPVALDITAGLVEPLGMETLVHFSLGAESSVARLLPQSSIRSAAALRLAVDMDRVHLLDAETDKVLG
jgi:multiple sugar transport system ATP-binding protein